MSVSRGDGHTATLLSNGKVLVAGGGDGSVNRSSAELYDPATGTWSPTGTMTDARVHHTATLLPNGKVLVAGGVNNEPWGWVATAELYDPTTGTWSATGSMTMERWFHTATLLPNGKVLVAGGRRRSGWSTNGADLYDPGTGTWSSTGSMLDSRVQHIAALLPDGKVLVAGGFGGSGDYGNTSFLPTAELYNPATGTWSATGTMFEARSNSTATLLPNGKVLVAGGMNTSVYLGSAVLPTGTELYDPGTGTWSTAGTMTDARVHHTETLLSNGKVLVAGGHGVNNVIYSAELYTPKGTPILSCEGFEYPMNAPFTLAGNTKSRIFPLRMSLYDEGGPIINTDIERPPLYQFVLSSTFPDPLPTSTSLPQGTPDDGNQFIFRNGKWELNLPASTFSASGTYTIRAVSGDPTEYKINPTCEATFVIPKKGGKGKPR